MADEPWILSEGRHRTHAALREGAARAAGGFRALGVREGDAVALLLGNGLPFLEASLGAALAGAHPVPIDGRSAPGDVGFILRDCSARLLVGAADLLAGAGPALPAGLPVVAVEDLDGWDAWTALHAPLASPATAPRGAVIYTSGTTGRPKGVRRAPSPAGSRPVRALRVYGFDRPGRATALIDGPLTHSVPNAFARLALGAGADIVLRPRFDPEATLAAIARHRVTHLHIVPSAMMRLLALPERVRDAHDLSSLRHAVHGAAPCPPHVKRAMVDWWGPVIHEYYGSTETGLLTVQGSAEALAKPGSVGRALPGIALHILDPEGRDLPPGEVGEVYAGSDTLHGFTYIGAPDRRAAIGRGDLVTAGDLGWLDNDGALHLADRKRDVVEVGGVAVYPAAVEAALAALPGVGDCAAFGVAGPDGAPMLVACVSPSGGCPLDGEALRAALAASLPPERVPRRVAVLDGLPRAESGKMRKDELRALFAKGSARA